MKHKFIKIQVKNLYLKIKIKNKSKKLKMKILTELLSQCSLNKKVRTLLEEDLKLLDGLLGGNISVI